MTQPASELELRKKPLDSQIFFDLDLILSHFADKTVDQPLFPRKISSLKLNNAQVEVFSVEQALNFYKESAYLDCRINAYPSHTDYKGIQRYPPNLIFIDLDKTNFSSGRALKLVLTNTLKNIREKLNGHPTVLFTGGGYHIYQPIESVILENVIQFSKFDHPSVQFLRFAEKFLSNEKSDQYHNISFRSCMIRIPGSYNSKYGKDTIVKIKQNWDGYRPPISLLLGNFHAYLVNQKIKEVKLKRLDKSYSSKYSGGTGKIQWIEILLQTPIDDYRKNTVALILAPYLINIKKLSYQESFLIIKDWLKKCSASRELDENFDYRIKYSLDWAIRKYMLPIRFETLNKKNKELHKLLIDKMQASIN